MNLLMIVDPFPAFSNLLFDHPEQSEQLGVGELVNLTTLMQLMHQKVDFEFLILLDVLLQQVLCLGGAFLEIGLLVRHFLLAFDLRQAVEASVEVLSGGEGRPDDRMVVVGAVDDGEGVNAAESGEFAHFLH